jgi:predicted protein tyrosine phosphatase
MARRWTAGRDAEVGWSSITTKERFSHDWLMSTGSDNESESRGERRGRPGRRATTTNLLFVCSRNQWRSPTAERVFSRDPDLAVRSAGTSPASRRRVGEADIDWADVIFVVEVKHRAHLRARFGHAIQHKTVHVLDIPDDYGFMDAELIHLLELAVPALLP